MFFTKIILLVLVALPGILGIIKTLRLEQRPKSAVFGLFLINILAISAAVWVVGFDHAS